MSTQVWQAYTTDEQALSVLNALVKADGLSTGVVFKGGCVEALTHLSQSAPSCLLVSLHSEHDMMHALKMLATQCTQLGVKLLVLGQEGQMLSFEMLKRVGVNAYLPAPFSEDALRTAIHGTLNEVIHQEAAEYETKIFICLGCYPGVGASTVCANVAACMAEQQETLLIDLDPLGGGVWSHFGRPVISGLLEMLDNPQRIDQQLYKTTRVLLSEQLYGLGEQLPLDSSTTFSSVGLQQLLSFLYGQVPAIFLDVPYHHTHLLSALIPYTHRLMLVLDESEQTVIQLARLLPLLEACPRSQWQLWFNNVHDVATVNVDVLLEKIPGVSYQVLPHLGNKIDQTQIEESSPFVNVYPRQKWSRVCRKSIASHSGDTVDMLLQLRKWIEKFTGGTYAKSSD